MIKRDRLVGWLVILRLNLRDNPPFCMPRCVREELECRGWLELVPHGSDFRVRVTDAGAMEADLCSPEWGVDPIAVGGRSA